MFYLQCIYSRRNNFLECYIVEDIRKKYMLKYFWCHPNIPTFIERMWTDNVTIFKHVSAFGSPAFEN